MTWSGVCLRAIVSVIPPVSIVGHEYSQSHWTTFRGPNQLSMLWLQLSWQKLQTEFIAQRKTVREILSLELRRSMASPAWAT